MKVNDITRLILDAAVTVHRRLGPGLLEGAYQPCLGVELKKRHLDFGREFPVPLIYDGVQLDCAYRLDFLVEGRVVVETKAVQKLISVHTAQVLSYLRLGGYEVGLLINFNVPYLGEGAVRRLVNGYRGQKPRDSR